jgi:uncharacterized surface anchored protein
MAKGKYLSKISLMTIPLVGIGLNLVLPSSGAYAIGAAGVPCAGGTILNAGQGTCALIDGEETWWGTYTGFNSLSVQGGVIWCGDGLNNGKFFPNPSYNYAPASPPPIVNPKDINGVGYALSYLDQFGIVVNGTNYTALNSPDGAVAGRLLIWDMLYDIPPSGASSTQMQIYSQLLALAQSSNVNEYSNTPLVSVNFTTPNASPTNLTVNNSYTTSVSLMDAPNGSPTYPYANLPVTLSISNGYFNAAGNPTSITLMTNANGTIPIVTFTPTTPNTQGQITASAVTPSNGLRWFSPTTYAQAQDGIGAGGGLNAASSPFVFKANAPLGTVQVDKTGNDPARSVQGAVFTAHDVTSFDIPDQQLIIGPNGLSQQLAYPQGDTVDITETTPPSGYQAAAPQSVVILGNQNIVVNFSDSVIPATVTVDKTGNDPARSVQGAVFTINDQTGKPVGTITTGTNGVSNTLSLSPDQQYTAVETTPPSGYQAAAPQSFDPTPGQSVTLNFSDSVIPATLQIKKTGDDQSFLPVTGAIFQVIDPSGKVLDTLTIGSNGMSQISSSLPPDEKLTLHEEQAPAGYQVAPDQVVSLTPDAQDVTFTFNDQAMLGQLTIKKVSSSTGNLLAGATFNVTQADGTFVAKVTTDQTGVATIPNLMPGNYVVTEVGAPAGYGLSSPINVSVTPNNNVITTDSDSPLSSANGNGSNTIAPVANVVSVPSANTGALWSNPIAYFGGASFTGVSGGLLMLFGKKRKRNQ